MTVARASASPLGNSGLGSRRLCSVAIVLLEKALHRFGRIAQGETLVGAGGSGMLGPDRQYGLFLRSVHEMLGFRTDHVALLQNTGIGVRYLSAT